jgi:hypothetical protein
LEDLQEEDTGDRFGEDVRREEDQPKDTAAAKRPVQQQRDAECEWELEADREHREDRVVLHRLPEERIAEGFAVVVQADEVGQVPETGPGIEAVVNGLDDRDEQEEDVERGCRPDEEGDLDPLAARACDDRPCMCAAGRRGGDARHLLLLCGVHDLCDDLLGVRLARELVRDRQDSAAPGQPSRHDCAVRNLHHQGR